MAFLLMLLCGRLVLCKAHSLGCCQLKELLPLLPGAAQWWMKLGNPLKAVTAYFEAQDPPLHMRIGESVCL